MESTGGAFWAENDRRNCIALSRRGDGRILDWPRELCYLAKAFIQRHYGHGSELALSR